MCFLSQQIHVKSGFCQWFHTQTITIRNKAKLIGRVDASVGGFYTMEIHHRFAIFVQILMGFGSIIAFVEKFFLS